VLGGEVLNYWALSDDEKELISTLCCSYSATGGWMTSDMARFDPQDGFFVRVETDPRTKAYWNYHKSCGTLGAPRECAPHVLQEKIDEALSDDNLYHLYSKYTVRWIFFDGDEEIPSTRKFTGHDVLSIQRNDDKSRDVVLVGPLPGQPTRMSMFDVVVELEQAVVEPSQAIGSATASVNLRAGPGTNYPKFGVLAEGQEFTIISVTSDGQWYQLNIKEGGYLYFVWVSADYVTTDVDVTLIPTVSPEDIPATPVPKPTDTPGPTPTPRPALPDVRITTVYNLSRKEYVQITNQGAAPQDMGGWSVSGSRGDERYTFSGGYVLAAGATVRLHSGRDGVDAYPTDIYWTTKNVWNNEGETVYLWDAQGNQVATYSY
jgi:hypothetical protein